MRRFVALILKGFVVLLCVGFMAGVVSAQEQQTPPERHGKILFEGDSSNMPAPTLAVQAEAAAQTVPLTDAERDAPIFTAYDLDVHLKPADSRVSVHARVHVRNGGEVPLTKLAMQLSFTLRWESISLENGGVSTPVPFVRQTVDSDVDHSGDVSEAVITLPQALAPGKEIALDMLYSGQIMVNALRLENIGTPHDTAVAADWDNIGSGNTNLRGFGNVVWYPVASAPALLGEANKLFRTVGLAKLRQQDTPVHMRLTVEYVGEPPDAAYFCGRREPLKAVSENPNLPVTDSPGVATAEWSSRPLGFRAMSLFLTHRAPQSAADGLLSVVTERDDIIPAYATAVKLVQPMLAEWFGPAQGTLTLIDHPGQPFQDGALLVAPLQTITAGQMAPLLSHAYLRSSHPWLEEGASELTALLWLERSQGRDAALKALEQNAAPIALMEPGNPESATGSDVAEALTAAHSEVFYRLKAAAVLWMLRAATSDDALKQAFKSYRTHAAMDSDAAGFEHALETSSGKDLQAFFSDWVYHDRGLPDLSIVNVTPSLMKQNPNDAASWLVAVNLRNDGEAAADVPVTVRSGKGSSTQSVHVGSHEAAVVRILFSGAPEEVVVNDGSVPEMATTNHRREVVTH